MSVFNGLVQTKGRLFFLLFRGFFYKAMELLWRFGVIEKKKMEGEMEVSIMELYYSVEKCFCEYKKGSVCRCSFVNDVRLKNQNKK